MVWYKVTSNRIQLGKIKASLKANHVPFIKDKDSAVNAIYVSVSPGEREKWVIDHVKALHGKSELMAEDEIQRFVSKTEALERLLERPCPICDDEPAVPSAKPPDPLTYPLLAHVRSAGKATGTK